MNRERDTELSLLCIYFGNLMRLGRVIVGFIALVAPSRLRDFRCSGMTRDGRSVACVTSFKYERRSIELSLRGLGRKQWHENRGTATD